jgi:hypothetical protein
MGLQRDAEVIANIRDSKIYDFESTAHHKISEIRAHHVDDYLEKELPDWEPSIEVKYRSWQLKDPNLAQKSPFEIFWAFFHSVAIQLVHCTNAHARLYSRPNEHWHDVTILEIRHWLAIRLYSACHWSEKARWDGLWAQNHPVIRSIGRNRFQAIERHLALYDESEVISNNQDWYWKVANGLNALRSTLKDLIIPSSHLTVDESIIKFSGRMRETYRLPHKPAGEGFLLYALNSHSGLLQDFIVTGSQSGIDGIHESIKIDIATRTTRKRKRGTGSIAAQAVTLSATQQVVFDLCERNTRDIRGLNSAPFACYIDNLFTNVPLVKALRSINIGSCGTARTTTAGFPVILAAIKTRFPKKIQRDQNISAIIDDTVNCTL